MPIVVVFQSPNLTREKYEQAVRQLTGGKRSRMEARSDWPVPGLLVHAAGPSPAGFRVVDVWESEAAFRRFGETLGPILAGLGIEGPPEVYEAHAFVAS